MRFGLQLLQRAIESLQKSVRVLLGKGERRSEAKGRRTTSAAVNTVHVEKL